MIALGVIIVVLLIVIFLCRSRQLLIEDTIEDYLKKQSVKSYDANVLLSGDIPKTPEPHIDLKTYDVTQLPYTSERYKDTYLSGDYGNVTVLTYNGTDDKYFPLWTETVEDGIYLRNSRAYWHDQRATPHINDDL